jgi:co-chaperonin GroES (HSP10)
MKKLILVGAFIASVFSASAQQTVGKIFSGPNEGKGFQLGSEKSSQVVLDATKAYNSNDSQKELSYYSEEMQKKTGDFNKKWHAYAKTLNDVPLSIMPMKVAGSTDEIVFMRSKEERETNDGSKQTMNLFEIFTIDKEGKIKNFAQYSSIPATNEFGKTSGGKIISKDENNGRAFQFSNRGEVAAIENLNKAYNAMDLKTVASFFAEKINITDFDGNKIVLENKDLHLLMDPYSSLDWKIWGILPFKIAETDPVSGILVTATEKRVLKDGSVWNKSLAEFFQFDLNGKISGVTQYSHGIK